VRYGTLQNFRIEVDKIKSSDVEFEPARMKLKGGRPIVCTIGAFINWWGTKKYDKLKQPLHYR
jgi:hypothetical protein